ncbi:hypothetical protein [Lysinibacillus sp. LZ02]|uniref:hypothetical protein n=1 Tax=Lysinibacillus sp. LZ02 TaxID=3420668 RepID=UPI003D364A92
MVQCEKFERDEWIQQTLYELLTHYKNTPFLCEQLLRQATYNDTLQSFKQLKSNETAIIQSGKPLAKFTTNSHAPRLITVNNMLVPNWTTPDIFDQLQQKNLVLEHESYVAHLTYFSHYSVLYTTYLMMKEMLFQKNTIRAFDNEWILSSGLGVLSSATVDATSLLQTPILIVARNGLRAKQLLEKGSIHHIVYDAEIALHHIQQAVTSKQYIAVVLIGDVTEQYEQLANSGARPTLLIDQTPLNRQSFYTNVTDEQIQKMIQAIQQFIQRDTAVMDFGNGLSQLIKAYTNQKIETTMQHFLRPLLLEGKEHIHFMYLSDDKQEIAYIHKVLNEKIEQASLKQWLQISQQHCQHEQFYIRDLWLSEKETIAVAIALNQLIEEQHLSAPLVMSKGLYNTSTAVAPKFETENLKDNSDTIADWLFLQALLSTSSGASWITIAQHTPTMPSIHTLSSLVLDGQIETEKRIHRFFHNQARFTLLRHAYAGYSKSVAQVTTD